MYKNSVRYIICSWTEPFRNSPRNRPTRSWATLSARARALGGLSPRENEVQFSILETYRPTARDPSSFRLVGPGRAIWGTFFYVSRGVPQSPPGNSPPGLLFIPEQIRGRRRYLSFKGGHGCASDSPGHPGRGRGNFNEALRRSTSLKRFNVYGWSQTTWKEEFKDREELCDAFKLARGADLSCVRIPLARDKSVEINCENSIYICLIIRRAGAGRTQYLG